MINITVFSGSFCFVLLKQNLVFEFSSFPLHCYVCVNFQFQLVKCIFCFTCYGFQIVQYQPSTKFSAKGSFIELQYWNQNLLCPLLSLMPYLAWLLYSLFPGLEDWYFSMREKQLSSAIRWSIWCLFVHSLWNCF